MIAAITRQVFGCRRALCLVVGAALLTGVAGCGKSDEESTSVPTTPVPSVIGMPDAQPAGSPDDVMVTVNGKSLTRGEADAQVARVMSQPRMASTPPERRGELAARIRQDAMDRFVVQHALRAEANRQGITVEDEDVSTTLEELSGRLPQGVTMESALAASGMTVAEFRVALAEDMKVQKLIDQQLADIPEATEEEVAAFYEEQAARFQTPETVHARHILVSCAADADEATRTEKKALIDECRKLLVDGGDFAVLAGEHSDCPSKEAGGDLGTFPRGQMVPEFEAAAFSQETNAVGPVVETPFGYHIIQVLEHNEAKTAALEEVASDVAAMLLQQKKQEEASKYIELIKSGADITYGGTAAP